MKHDPVTGTSKTLSDDDIMVFCDYFYRRTGIRFSLAKRYFLEKRIVKRMAATGHDDFRRYFSHLRFGASEELQNLINAMTVNETYFFREDHQFDTLVGDILNEVAATHRRRAPITIWSIPCSTGEEPYSIAMKLLEEWPRLAHTDVRIFGSDIDTAVLATAEKGLYSNRSVSRMPPAYLEKYFTKRPGGRYQLDRSIIDAVDLDALNVTDRAALDRMPRVDVIFCRNMLIYFDDAARRQTIQGFHDLLNPGGFLLLGHSESLSRTACPFKVRKFRDAIAYQKEG